MKEGGTKERKGMHRGQNEESKLCHKQLKPGPERSRNKSLKGAPKGVQKGPKKEVKRRQNTVEKKG